MKLEVQNIEGKSTGRSVDLSKEVYGVEPNDHAIYLAVKHYMANQRQGTASSKSRGEVKGSRKKIRKQKGTGGARFGDIKSPILRGGGRIFGPEPREYRSKLNKKVSVLARKSALSYKAQDNNIVVVENFSFDEPKTKDFQAIMDKLGVSDVKTLLVLEDQDNAVSLSSRNIRKSQVTTADTLNSYDVLDAQKVLISEGAVKKIEETLKNSKK